MKLVMVWGKRIVVVEMVRQISSALKASCGDLVDDGHGMCWNCQSHGLWDFVTLSVSVYSVAAYIQLYYLSFVLPKVKICHTKSVFV